MIKFTTHLCLLSVLGIFTLYTPVQADMLRMSDGRVLSGTYQGGSKDAIHFQEKNSILNYPLAEVQFLNFGDISSGQTSQQNLFSLPAAKHMVIKKNGQIVLGLFQGGTKDTVSFQGESGIQNYSATNMIFLIFNQTKASQASKSVFQTQAATQEQDVVTLSAGTSLMVRLSDTLRSDKNQTGDSFLTTLEVDLALDGIVVAPRGTHVYGKITQVRKGHRVAGKAKIEIVLSYLEINRQLYPIVTTGYEASGDRQGSFLKTGTGALIGEAIDNEDGAKIGAAIGVGVSVVSDGKQIQIEKSSLLEFTLQKTTTVPIAHSTSPNLPSLVDSNDVPIPNWEKPATRSAKGRGRGRR